MHIGMNLPVMAPGLDRGTFLAWCRAVDQGPFHTLAAGERIAFYPCRLDAEDILWSTRRSLVASLCLPRFAHSQALTPG